MADPSREVPPDPHEHECAGPTLSVHTSLYGATDWREICDHIVAHVAGHEEWASVVPRWLEEIAAAGIPDRIAGGIRDRCDTLQCLVDLGAGYWWVVLPGFHLGVRRGQVRRHLGSGTLTTWGGGKGDLLPVRDIVRGVYPDRASWVQARRTGRITETDRQLRSALCLVHFICEGRDPAERRVVAVDERGRLVRRLPDRYNPSGKPVWNDRRSLGHFASRHESELSAIAAEYAAPDPEE